MSFVTVQARLVEDTKEVPRTFLYASANIPKRLAQHYRTTDKEQTYLGVKLFGRRYMA